jgi:hypothetical protein
VELVRFQSIEQAVTPAQLQSALVCAFSVKVIYLEFTQKELARQMADFTEVRPALREWHWKPESLSFQLP